MSAEPILPLRFEGVGFRAGGRRLIDDLSFVVESGGPTVILGPNGAGKSLTLRLAHGLLSPSEGRVVFAGRGDDGDERVRRAQAMVFQRPVLLRRSAAANVAYALALRGVQGDERTRRVRAALERTGLQALAARPARVLSGGEGQRLALARAWVLEPELLFLDEPTASLDPGATHEVEALIRAIAAEGRKVVMTTHDLGQARRLAADVLFLDRGRLVEQSPAGRFFEAPESHEARAFLRGDLLW